MLNKRFASILVMTALSGLPFVGDLRAAPEAKALVLDLQRRDPGTGEPGLTRVTVDPAKIGIVIIDMWNFHWCMTCAERAGAMVPRMNRALEGARRLGVQVIWAPTDVASHYAGAPQRETAAAVAYRPIPAARDLTWRGTIGGGCMCGPGVLCLVNYGWDGMHPDLQIAAEDLIAADQNEIYALLKERGITHIIYMGVHTNVCVLGKPPALKNMYAAGFDCILARDLTDAETWYDPEKGFTPDQGTERVVADIEKHGIRTIHRVEAGFKLRAVATAQFSAPIEDAGLPGTAPLTLTGDIASELVAGVDRFLLRELEKSIERRARHWKRDFSSREAYERSVEPNRKRLAQILGMRDERVQPPAMTGFYDVASVYPSAEIFLPAASHEFEVHAVRWSAFGDVHGEGLLLQPTASRPVATIIALPDAEQTPEAIAGLLPGVPPESQYARRLAENGCRVLVPVLVSRELSQRRNATLTHREFLYRSAFELGRHLIGYEVQKVLAAVDWLSKSKGEGAKIGVIGWGEGGLIALYAAALDRRIGAACVSGYFDSRQSIWQEPIDRNVSGLLDQFGDAEVASLVAPRALIIEAARSPEVELPGKGGAPARLVSPQLEDVRREVERARALVRGLDQAPRIELVQSGDGNGPCGSEAALQALLDQVSPGAKLAPPDTAPRPNHKGGDPAERLRRQIDEIDRHNQWLLRESEYVRKDFFKDLKTDSLESYSQSIEHYRDVFRDEVIGRFDEKPLPPNPRSRKAYDKEKWTGYEVVLDVFPDVFAYGILLLPKDLKPGEKRPVVVCQHGLEGRPQHVVEGDIPAYHDFAARLAERGFITFAPQNLYIFGDRFRTLQRKANPLGKTLFSIIVPQHQQIVDWLKTLPYVDPTRIGFYGLSYGGKTAMRVPALVTDYALSICSADFNEWVWKNASTRSPYSYVWTGEYEIFEFDLGSTFNYAEMAALIAPRPFMVERGHFDGVAPDEAVAYEFAKVRHLYAAKLGIGDRSEIEFFVGPHTINGKGTFDFLHKHLNWPKP